MSLTISSCSVSEVNRDAELSAPKPNQTKSDLLTSACGTIGCSSDPGKFVVRDLTLYERNVVSFQNQRFPTRQSMSFLKGESFLFFLTNMLRHSFPFS